MQQPHTNMLAPLVNLQPHQRMACDFMLTHPACGLFLEMGCGKTLTVLEGLYELNPSSHVLVIGPKPVVNATWVNEIQKFNFPFRTNSLVINEKGRQRKPADRHALYLDLPNIEPTIWFINREMVCDLIDHLPKKGKATIWPFPIVIIDEAQAFKSYSSKRFKALAKMRPAISRIIELSGTPTPNGLQDLWPLIYLLAGGERLGDCITRYREMYFYPDPYIRTPQGYPAKWHLKQGADQQIYNKVSDIVISMKNIAAVMPPITYNDIRLTMSDKEWSLYKEFARESIIEFEQGSVVAANAAVLQAKLLQLASGALYLNNTNTSWQEIHQLKLDATSRIVADAGSPVLIAYWFKSDKEIILNRMKEDGIECYAFDGTPEMINDWNAGKIPAMLIQPASAGHGLNLQAGGHTLIWYTLSFNLEHYLQTNARIYRQGQKHPVIIHRLIVNRTVDEVVSNALESKQTDSEAFAAALRYTANQVM